jgi:hypothetical protein
MRGRHYLRRIIAEGEARRAYIEHNYDIDEQYLATLSFEDLENTPSRLAFIAGLSAREILAVQTGSLQVWQRRDGSRFLRPAGYGEQLSLFDVDDLA